MPDSAMGLAFEEVPLKSAALLREWLLKASGGSEGPVKERTLPQFWQLTVVHRFPDVIKQLRLFLSIQFPTMVAAV